MRIKNENGNGKRKWNGEVKMRYEKEWGSCNLFGVDGEYTKKAPLYEI